MPNGQAFWEAMAEARGRLGITVVHEEDDWNYTDILWYRPKESPAPGQPTAFVDVFMPLVAYTLRCDRCDSEWLEEVTPDSRPRCFCCGRFVHLSYNYRDARALMKRQEKDA